MLKASFSHDVPMQRTYDAIQAQKGVSGAKMVGTTLFEFILSQSKMHDAVEINYAPKGTSNKLKVLMAQHCPERTEEEIDSFLANEDIHEYRTNWTYNTYESCRDYSDTSVEALIEQGYVQPLEGTGETICAQMNCRNEEDVIRELDAYHTTLLRVNFNNTGRGDTNRGNGQGRGRNHYGGRPRDRGRLGHHYTKGSVPKWLWDKMTPEERKHWYGLESGIRIQLRTATQDSSKPSKGDTYTITQHQIISANETKQSQGTKNIPL